MKNKQTMEHENDGDSNYNLRALSSHQMINTGIAEFGNTRTSGAYQK